MTISKVTQVKVYFRVFPDGDVIALWEGSEQSPGMMSSYQHIGQHSDASRELVNTLRKATTGEKCHLLHELASIGYRVLDADEWARPVDKIQYLTMAQAYEWLAEPFSCHYALCLNWLGIPAHHDNADKLVEQMENRIQQLLTLGDE